jgi:hypothetical protein
MGKNHLFGLLVTAIMFVTLRGAHAMEKPAQFRVQNRDTVLGAKSFRPLKNVPDYMARLVPVDGKTKFYGEIEVKIGRKPASMLRVHFYEWELKTSDDVRDSGRCAVDVYVQQNPKDTFHLVSSVKDDTSGVNKSFGYPITFVNLMWLNNKTKTIPIVRFCCQAKKGFYGPVGQNLFLTFAKGLDEAPSAQNFENYSSHTDFVDWFFDDVDTRGNRQLIQLIDPLGEGEDKYVFWNWNEKELAFQPQKEARTE